MPSSHKGEKINGTSRPISERFAAQFAIDHETKCWLWLGHIGKNGYGSLQEGPTDTDRPRRRLLAHRVSYELYVGPIPEGLTIDHLCRVRHCVNPAHLEAVTLRENILRGTAFSAINAAKTHCPEGHLYDDQNTYRGKDGRRCRACDRRRSSERYYNNHAEQLEKRRLKRLESKT